MKRPFALVGYWLIKATFKCLGVLAVKSKVFGKMLTMQEERGAAKFQKKIRFGRLFFLQEKLDTFSNLKSDDFISIHEKTVLPKQFFPHM